MFEYIASVTGTGSSATLTFTGVPNTYDSLVLRGVCTATNSGEQEGYINFNGDNTVGNYRRTNGGRYGTLDGYGWNGATNSNFVFIPGSGQAPAGDLAAQVDMNIFAYRKAATVPGCPGMMSQGNYHSANTNYNSVQFLYSVWYTGDNSVDVTSIELLIANGSWGSDTKFHLFGRTEA